MKIDFFKPLLNSTALAQGRNGLVSFFLSGFNYCRNALFVIGQCRVSDWRSLRGMPFSRRNEASHFGKTMTCALSGVHKRVLLPLVAITLLAGVARSGEEPNWYERIMSRYKVINDEVEQTLAHCEGNSPLSELPERVFALGNNATVSIRGEIRSGYVASTAKGKSPGFDSSSLEAANHNSKTRGFDITAAKLLIDAVAWERWRMFFDIDMTGYGGRHRSASLKNPNTASTADTALQHHYHKDFDSRFVQQAYLEFMKKDASGFGFLGGLMKLPFGLWNRPNTFFQSYLHAPNMNSSYLMGSEGWNNAVLMPHTSRFVEPSLALMANYEFCDFIRFDAAVFQEDGMEQIYSIWGDVREQRSDSSFPRSWQLGMSILPREGWELTAHFRNRHSSSHGISRWANTPTRWDFRHNLATVDEPKWDDTNRQWSDSGAGPGFGATENEQSIIVGVAAEVPGSNLTVRAEYAHGWNQGFNKHIASDDVNLGLEYKATPRMTLHAQGEWLHVRDRSWIAGNGQRDRRDNHLYRFMLGAEYEVVTGLKLEAGWQYEYCKQRSQHGGIGGGAAKRTSAASSFYIGTRFLF